MRGFRILLLCCAMISPAMLAQNADNSAGTMRYADTGNAQRLQIAVGYSYVRSNANPGQCGCFNMNGGNLEADAHVYRRFSVVADLTGGNAASVNGGTRGLSLLSFTAGPRFSYFAGRGFTPFIQSLFGVAHGFDSYFPVTSGSTSSANGFAMLAGGGLDIRISRHVAIRAIEADYYLTHLPNGVDDTQRNLSLNAGVVLRVW